jgi:zinc transport system substrate-binding protein
MFTVILLILITIGILIVGNTSKKNKELGVKLNVTATFYPQYIALMNIMDGAKNVKYDILNSQNVGCLHHYFLTTADMKKLENSDVIVLNGAGMEEKIIEYINGINKKIIDSSEQISTLQDENEINAHTFLSIKNYIKQVENIRDGLINLDKENVKSTKVMLQNILKNWKV